MSVRNAVRWIANESNQSFLGLTGLNIATRGDRTPEAAHLLFSLRTWSMHEREDRRPVNPGATINYAQGG
jgi:hypothetical protein